MLEEARQRAEAAATQGGWDTPPAASPPPCATWLLCKQAARPDGQSWQADRRLLISHLWSRCSSPCLRSHLLPAPPPVLCCRCRRQGQGSDREGAPPHCAGRCAGL